MTVKKPSNPSLSDTLSLLKKEIMLSMNCHAVGKIEAFDKDNQTVQATMGYKKTFVKYENGKQVETLVDYPILLDCPAVVMSGGAFSLKMPIKKGDECLIMFNDRSIDRWFESGQVVSLESSRLHSFSDAIVLVGIKSLANSLTGYVSEQVVLGDGETDLKLGAGEASLNNGTTIIKASAEKILLTNAVESLNLILQDLIAQIQLITVSGVTSGPAVSGPPANAAAIAAIGTRLGGLLE